MATQQLKRRISEEPDAGNLQVRFCEGAGGERRKVVATSSTRPLPALFRGSFLSSFDDSDFRFCQSIQLVHQLVNLLVGRGNLALDGGLVGRGAGLGQVFAQLLHPLDQRDHLVVTQIPLSEQLHLAKQFSPPTPVQHRKCVCIQTAAYLAQEPSTSPFAEQRE